MIIGTIKNGIVIDHIPAGRGMELYKYLKLDDMHCEVALIKNAVSNKLEKKDILKVNEVIDLNFDLLGYIAPRITVNVITDGVITKKVADEALRALEIDDLGLDPIDHRMMHAIIENYGGGPVGIETLAATIGEEAVTLLDVYEPYLMQLGFLQRTPRGRCVTRKAYEHLGLSVPKSMDEVPEQLSL